jgi:hypothetical protein
MGHRGNPYDIAKAENSMKSLKIVGVNAQKRKFLLLSPAMAA